MRATGIHKAMMCTKKQSTGPAKCSIAPKTSRVTQRAKLCLALQAAALPTTQTSCNEETMSLTCQPSGKWGISICDLRMLPYTLRNLLWWGFIEETSGLLDISTVNTKVSSPLKGCALSTHTSSSGAEKFLLKMHFVWFWSPADKSPTSCIPRNMCQRAALETKVVLIRFIFLYS